MRGCLHCKYIKSWPLTEILMELIEIYKGSQNKTRKKTLQHLWPRFHLDLNWIQFFLLKSIFRPYSGWYYTIYSAVRAKYSTECWLLLLSRGKCFIIRLLKICRSNNSWDQKVNQNIEFLIFYKSVAHFMKKKYIYLSTISVSYLFGNGNAICHILFGDNFEFDVMRPKCTAVINRTRSFLCGTLSISITCQSEFMQLLSITIIQIESNLNKQITALYLTRYSIPQRTFQSW